MGKSRRERREEAARGAAAPAPAPAGLPGRAEAAAMGAAGLGLLALYLSWPEKVFVFDGIMFASVIERGIDEWRRELLNRRHLLFNPLMMGLRDALARAGAEVGAYELMQRTNAVLGAAGIILHYRLTAAAARDRAVAALSAALLAVTAAYWSRACEGQVYMAMTAGALAAAWTSLRCLRVGTRGSALALAAALAGGVLVHAALVFLLPMALAAWWLGARRSGAFRPWVPAAAWAALVAVPYLAAFRIAGPDGLFSFLLKATEFYGSSGESGWGALGGVLASRLASPLALVSATLRALFASAAFSPLSEAARAWAGLPLALAFAAAGRLAWAEPEDRAPAAVLALGALGFAGLDAAWRGGLFFWAVPWALGLALASLPAARALARPGAPRGAALAAGAVLAVGLGAWNLKAGILPQSRLENNEGYRRTLFIQEHTVGSSWIVISGLGYPNSKVYLPHFAQRSRQVLEYFLLGRPKERGLREFSEWVRGAVEAGMPLYLLSDLIEDEKVFAQMREAWGVTPAEIAACFGAGQVVPLAEQDPGFRLFLFVPEARRDRLFASLAYSALTVPEGPRLATTAAALRWIAERLSPEQRRLAARTLVETGYGFDLLRRGFAGYMSPESARRAEQRLALFQGYQRTANFRLRLGNIYRLLGLKAETLREWREAYRLSPDPRLKRDIEALQRG